MGLEGGGGRRREMGKRLREGEGERGKYYLIHYAEREGERERDREIERQRDR